MPNTELVIPQYSYHADTKLADLWQTWLTANNLSQEQGIKILQKKGIKGSANLSKWMKNETTLALLTSMLKKITELTGIDLDRWMIIRAMQDGITKHPELKDAIMALGFKTREDLVEDIRRYEQLYGQRYFVAIQLDLPAETLRHWLSGLNKPSLDGLRTAIPNCARGMIEGSKDDVTFIMMTRKVLGKNPSDCLNVSNFTEAIRELLRPLRDWTIAKIEGRTGLQPNIIKKLRIHDESSSQYMKQTVEDVFRLLVLRQWPNLTEALQATIVEYRETGSVKTSILPELEKAKVEEPVQTEMPTTDSMPDNGALLTTTLTPRAWLQDLMRHGAETLDRVEDSDVNALVAPSAARRSISEVIGETIGGVKHCVSADNYQGRPGEQLSADDLQQIIGLVGALRLIVVDVILTIDPPDRETAMQILAPHFDELFLSRHASEFARLLGSWPLIKAARTTTHLSRTLQQGEPHDH